MLPWLIYIMIVIVGLGLAAVLQVVIPLGALRQPDWILVIVGSAGCLAVAGLLLYFWIVVLELFIRLGPIYEGQDPYLSQCHCQTARAHEQDAVHGGLIHVETTPNWSETLTIRETAFAFVWSLGSGASF